jgi:class 3 adenylate cyclase
MTEQQRKEDHFRQLKADYEKALEYQYTDKQAALFTARNIAEAICYQLVQQETSRDPKGLQLDALIGKLIVAKAVSPLVLAPLRAIQYYGNLGTHYQKQPVTIAHVQACLYSLFVAVNWYFETYWPESRVTIPFADTVISDDDVNQVETYRKTQTTAILVIMFLDMVHSTETRELLGEQEFEELRQQKKGILMSLIEKEDRGKLIKDLGDGYLAIFSVPSAAVETALEIQETLAVDPDYQVRIGLDMGQVTQETDRGIMKNVFGRHVNLAARAEALCEGGHILTSYTVWNSAEGWLKHLKQIAWKEHGSYWLKGFSRPQEIYEPYNPQRIEPLNELPGKKATPEEELVYCKRCGRNVKRTATFKCRTCGTEGICTEYCFDSSQRQCLECSSKTESHATKEQDTAKQSYAEKLIVLENPQSSFTVKIWTEYSEKRGTTRDILVAPKKEFGKYKIDDKVVAYFESSADAYVYMINIGPTGQHHPYFPHSIFV